MPLGHVAAQLVNRDRGFNFVTVNEFRWDTDSTEIVGLLERALLCLTLDVFGVEPPLPKSIPKLLVAFLRSTQRVQMAMGHET